MSTANPFITTSFTDKLTALHRDLQSTPDQIALAHLLCAEAGLTPGTCVSVCLDDVVEEVGVVMRWRDEPTSFFPVRHYPLEVLTASGLLELGVQDVMVEPDVCLQAEFFEGEPSLLRLEVKEGRVRLFTEAGEQVSGTEISALSLHPKY